MGSIIQPPSLALVQPDPVEGTRVRGYLWTLHDERFATYCANSKAEGEPSSAPFAVGGGCRDCAWRVHWVARVAGPRARGPGD